MTITKKIRAIFITAAMLLTLILIPTQVVFAAEDLDFIYSLEPGGTYYFDLSAQGIPGKTNPNLPDTSLKWVPFTYAGTVRAYSLDGSSNDNAGASDSAVPSLRTLFVADYNVSTDAAWIEYASAGLIFGKQYDSRNISYDLRSLSTGNSSVDGQGSPATNEWDQILNKNMDYIKNSGTFSWGQDTSTDMATFRSKRGKDSARSYYRSFNSSREDINGLRPALMVTQRMPADKNSLRAVTFDMDGNGTLGNKSLTSATVINNGWNITLTLPEITEANGFNYTGPGKPGWYYGDTFYEPGTEVDLPSGAVLKAGCKESEQLNLPLGTYYFDLSAQNIPGTKNTTQPDSSLKWVPFTYAGTVNAYSRTSAGPSTDQTVSVNKRSLFVADYNVTKAVSWDELNNAGLIFGKTFSKDGANYLLRSLSAGSNIMGSGDSLRGLPLTNEWDQILNKDSDYIKNTSEMYSWGQDTNLIVGLERYLRGYQSSPRGVWTASTGFKFDTCGFRPVLEIQNPDTLGMDGLKYITFNMGSQGTIGDKKTTTSAKVVYSDSLTLPAITEANGFNYSGPSGTGTLGWYVGSQFYKPGTTPTLAMGTVLTPGYSIAPTVTGPTAMSLGKGYSATSTGGYTITGTDSVTVSKTAGDARITWNSSTKKLDIAAGLEVGSYPVTLTASNGISPDTTLNFTLTVVLTYKVEVTPNCTYFNTAAEGYVELPAQNFIIRNTGSGTITGLKASVLEGSGFEISEPLTSDTIPPGGTATVKARPKTGLSKGPGLTIKYYETPLNITGDNGISVSVNLSFGVYGTAPKITGPTEMSLTEGYSATATGGYTITGTAPVTVSKTSGDDKITWDDTNKKLDIAAGLTTGSYPVVLTAQNSTLSNASLKFTLTVNATPVTVTSVTVMTSPTKTTYTAGELLDLSGLVVTLHKSNSTTEDVAFADFATKGITTTPANGTGLSVSDTAVNITYTADNQSVSQNITVNPAAVTVTSVTVMTEPTKITYTAGELLDLSGLVVTLHKSNSTTEDVVFADFATKGISTTPANGAGLSVSDTAVNISYTADNQSVSQNITVNLAAVTVTSVTVMTAPTKTTYTAGELLDLTGLVITLHKSDSTTEDVALADFGTKGITTTPTNGTGLSVSDSAVTITYTADSQSVSQNITVNPAAVTVTSVTVKTAPTQTTYTAGELLDLMGLVITLHKSDSTTEDVALADFGTKGITTTPANGTGLSVSDNAVTITYTVDNKSVSQNITVNPAAVTVTSVTVKTAPTKTTYTAGDLLDLTGLVVTLNKSDSTMEDVALADFGTKGITTRPANGTGLSVSDSAVIITYTADNKSVSQNITVNPAAVTVTLVTVKNQPTQITYTAGELLDLNGLVITLHKSNSTTEDVAFADFATKGITTTPTNGTGLSVSDSAVTITYTADHQSVSQNITVNPAAVTVTSVTVMTEPTKITYTAGELLDLSGLVVTLHKSNSTTEDVVFADFATKGISTTPANGAGLSVSDTAVNISYTADHQSVSQSITVNPAAVTVTLVTVKNQPTQTTYTAGDHLDLTGLVVTLHKSNSTTEDVASADFATKGITTTPANGTRLSVSDSAVNITYTADHQSVSQSITVKPAAVTVTSVTVKTAPTQITYTAGDHLDLSGLEVTLHKSNSITEDVAFADFATKGITTTPTNGTGLSVSDTSVTIAYTADHQLVSQSITVNPAAVTVTSVTVKNQPTQTTYTAGDHLDLTGLEVTLHKSNSTTEDVVFADFATKGITTMPANGTGLSVSDSAVNITYTADHQSVSQSITVNPAAVTVTSVTVKNQPTQTTYTAGDHLDLTGLVVTLHKSNSTAEDVAFANFATKGITTTPTNGTGLSVSDSAVTITYTTDNQSVSQNITVNTAPTITTTSSAISFGSLTAGYTTPPAIQTMTVKNTGNQRVTLTQPTSEHYAIGALSNNLLNKAETVTFTIQPKPGLVVGSYNENLIIAGTNETSASISLSFTVTEAPVTVAYRGHIQNIGDYPLDGSWVNSPELIGTVGQSKRIEGFEIRLGDAAPAEMELRYNVHVENKGWLYNENDCADWPKDGAYAGTRGESLRIEAVKLVLTDKDGKPYPGYSVYYRGHVQNVGDLPTKSADWYTDGEKLGTVGSALRLEALLVKVVKNETDLTAYPALFESIKNQEDRLYGSQ